MIPLMMIGTSEFLLIAVVILLLFGGKKLPELMKGLGQGVQSFKKGMNEPLPENPKDEKKETTEKAGEDSKVQVKEESKQDEK